MVYEYLLIDNQVVICVDTLKSAIFGAPTSTPFLYFLECLTTTTKVGRGVHTEACLIAAIALT